MKISKFKYIQVVSVLVAFGFLANAVSCVPFDQEAYERMNSVESTRVQFFTNSPGTRPENERNRMPAELLVEAIDRADATLDACVYGFSNQKIIDAVVRAYYRGVKVRVVGDARHLSYGDRGYKTMIQHRIPMQVGNQFHIMHNKYFVIDGRFTFVGTGNITTTGFNKNDNNWILIDDIPVADDFAAEFQQMFEGRFSTAKIPNFNGNRYQVGDTNIEVLFSPHEDTMGKILEELRAAHTSVHFQIFAFTKDQVGSTFIEKHREFTEYNESVGKGDLPVIALKDHWSDDNPDSGERPKKVVGIFDKSQIHGNGQFHEGYRIIANHVPVRLDANVNSFLPGDYQAGGGRLHTKTMILDYGTPDARVVTGSFNWSSSATIANDEVLMVIRGERVVEQFMNAWRQLWMTSVTIPDGLCVANIDYYDGGNGPGDIRCASDVQPGDIVISEVHWDGWNGLTDGSDRTGTSRDAQTNDEFIELYNTKDYPIDLSMWAIHNGFDANMGFTPGTVIGPKEHFLILDHNIASFSELEPQRGVQSFKNGDFVLNTINDPRFPRLNLKNSALRLELRAPKDTTGPNPDFTPNIIDAVGDYGPPFAGGRVNDKVYSMERVFTNGAYAADGTVPGSWKQCSATEGGENVNDEFKERVIATPGEQNSQ